MQNTNTKTDLLAFTLPQLQQWLVERGEAAFRAKQIFGWLYRQLVTDFAEMTNLSASLRQRLAEEASIGPMIVRSELHSKDDRTRKILLELADGKLVESVLMLYPPIPQSIHLLLLKSPFQTVIHAKSSRALLGKAC